MPANNNVVGVQGAPPTFGNFSAGPLVSKWVYPLGIFFALVTLFLVVFSLFNTQIKQAYEYVTLAFQKSMGLNNNPPPPPPLPPSFPMPTPVTMPPVAPQTITPAQDAAKTR